MAARPVLRRLLAEIERRGGWEKIIERIASGDTVLEIAQDFGVSRGFFSYILHRDKARSAQVAQARREAAHAAVDELKAIADSVAPTRDEIAKAKLRMEARVFIARTTNPEYREKGPDVNIQINAGTLHLDALRAQGARQALAQEQERAALPPAVEAEIVEESAETREESNGDAA